MPETDPTPVTDAKLKDRVAKLERDMAFIAKGCQRVSQEIGNEWGEETFGAGEAGGVKFSEVT